MEKQFSVEDLYLHRKITELACSPGSNRVAATVRAIDRENDKYLP